MGKTLIYVIGMLALAYSDFTHSEALHSIALPILAAAFIIFLVAELLFYFSLLGFSKGEYNLFDLGRDLFNFRDDIAEYGLLHASVSLLLALADFFLLFVALVYALARLLEAAIL
ncbi:MAG: hypothetical protein KJO24_03335 [Gammaproteobacteria bacterium]|nr:hypothetical protein [Gammaproteobacteria bacterium]